MERTEAISPRIVERIADSFFRHQWLFLISLCAVTGVVIGALLLRVRTYTARASTRIVTDDGMAEKLGVAMVKDRWISPAQQNVDLFNDLIRDDLPGGFLDTALRKARLDRPINLDPSANNPRYRLLRKRLYASADSNNLFTFGLTWDNPGECKRIVGALQDQYMEEVGLSQQAKAVATTKFLESEISDYDRRLRVAERALVDYKQNNSGLLPEAQMADIGHLSGLRTRLAELRITARDGELKRQALQKRLAEIKPMSIREQTMGDNPLAGVIQALEIQRDMQMVTKLENHPDVRQLSDKIDRLKKRLSQEAGGRSGQRPWEIITETKLQDNPEYQELMLQLTAAGIAQKTQQAQMQLVHRQMAEAEARIQRAPLGQRMLINKTRDYNILKAQYENLLQRREQAQIKANLDKVTAASTLGRIGIIHAEPTLSEMKMVGMLAASVLLGLVVALGMVVLSEWADTSVRDEYDVHRLLGVPVVAIVPDTPALRAALPGPGDGDELPREPHKMPPSSQVAPPSPAPAFSQLDEAALGDITLRLPVLHRPPSE